MQLARSNVRAHDAPLLDSGAVTLEVGDGWHGAPTIAPFDVIHVGAAAASVPVARRSGQSHRTPAVAQPCLTQPRPPSLPFLRHRAMAAEGRTPLVPWHGAAVMRILRRGFALRPLSLMIHL